MERSSLVEMTTRSCAGTPSKDATLCVVKSLLRKEISKELHPNPQSLPLNKVVPFASSMTA
jgi:hypothetical protein